MRSFARVGHFSSQGMRFSDFVSTRDGHAVYHLVPLLFLAAVVLFGFLILWIVFCKPNYSTISVPSGCLTAAIGVLLFIAIACIILAQFPAFALF